MHSSFHSSLAVNRVTAQTVGFQHISGLPTAKPVARDVLLETVLANGMPLSIQIGTLNDVDVIHDVLSAAEEKNRDKKYLVPRTKEHVAKALSYDENTQEGGFVLLMMLNGNQVGGVVGGEDIDDENDSGRGKAFKGCPIHRQFCFKMAGMHPSSKGLHIYEQTHDVRMALKMEMFPEKTCIITKTNNPQVKKVYGQDLGWTLAQIYDLKNDVIIPSNMYDKNNDDDKLLHTYGMPQETSLLRMARENSDLIKRSDVLKYLHERYSLAKSTENGLYVPA